MKNTCLKMRNESNPYEIWKNNSGWTWKVLKKNQADDSKPYASWYCSVSSPFSKGDYGDVYVSEIKSSASLVTVNA